MGLCVWGVGGGVNFQLGKELFPIRGRVKGGRKEIELYCVSKRGNGEGNVPKV